MKYYQPQQQPNPSTQRFMFATGIECSYPTIQTPHGIKRRDQLEECGHYRRWREDFQLTRDLGLSYLRYGPPYHRMHLGPERYDWSWTDEVLPELHHLRLVPIMDLCHFGVPDWLGDFQNPEFPRHFGAFARAFAARYPWVRRYTPVNEMYIAAEFSAWYGWWNECLQSHRAFVTALKHIVRANVEAMLAIMEVRPDALFIRSESSEYTHAGRPDLADEAEMFNERRFVPPLVVHLTGRQWWWEIASPTEQISTANEIHVPAGVAIRLSVTSEDVIHSFWVPQVAGKVDVIPGKVNAITFRVDQPGVYRGLCAEFCGLQHAHLHFRLFVDAPADFASWLAAQRRVPPAPTDSIVAQGQRIFLSTSSCAQCHTVQGTGAAGTRGPDLTHVASRRTLGAGTHENTRANLAGWTAEPQEMKPANKMPPPDLNDAEVRAVVAYLETLE